MNSFSWLWLVSLLMLALSPCVRAKQYPTVTAIDGGTLTIDAGEDYWIEAGQMATIWRDTSPAPVGRARVITVASQVAQAQLVGTSGSAVEIGDTVRLHPEVIEADDGRIVFGAGVNHGLSTGWVATLWRIASMDAPQSPEVYVRSIVGRALLVDVQSDTATGRILGKPNERPQVGDLLRVEKQTTVRLQSGSNVYLNVSSELIERLTPGMQVYAFRPRMVMHPTNREKTLRWKEDVGSLTIERVAPASYTALAKPVLNEGAASEGASDSSTVFVPGDEVGLEDKRLVARQEADRRTHVLKIVGDGVYVNTFEEAKKGVQLTLVKQPTSNIVGCSTSSYVGQVNEIYQHLVFIALQDVSGLQVGDRVEIYRAVGE